MASITPGSTRNSLDRNAVSADRTRRNWQRLVTGGVQQLVQLAPDGSLVLTKLGLAVLLDPNGAISSSASGLAVNVDGTTIMIVDDQLVGAPSGLTHQQVMGRISIGI